LGVADGFTVEDAGGFVVVELACFVAGPGGVVTWAAGVVTALAGVVTAPAGVVTNFAGVGLELAGVVAAELHPTATNAVTSKSTRNKTAFFIDFSFLLICSKRKRGDRSYP
jgi:hypothetical protein